MRKAITLIILLCSALFSERSGAQVLNEETFKIGRTLSLIDAFYVDTVNLPVIAEKVIIDMLHDLDPHSTYISAKDVREMNEPLIGNFEGIGIQFNILFDSIIVIEPIAGGPSERVGLRAGDRIVVINGENVAGKGISTTGVRNRLLGKKGTIVNISIFRRGEKELLDFSIARDRIPINSIDAAYMLDKETGYIKISRFAATTEMEFDQKVDSLRRNNMKNIVIDLRSNGGGYMLAATEIADKFFTDRKLLVYLIGRKTPRQEFSSSGNGKLAGSRVIILTDEQSASASEILAGAMQDWDRGIVVGRRTFGKGLVQNGYSLTDGSMIRLTVARYYTPSGRLIQSPYNEGYDKYIQNFNERFTTGELMSADSIQFPDSLKHKTLISGRTVYGGGGIMPDVFVPADTSNYSDYYRSLVRRGVLNTFVLEYADKNRERIRKQFTSFNDFNARFAFTSEEVKSFTSKAESMGIKYNETQFRVSEQEILMLLKALVANNLWQTNEYFMIINKTDKVVSKALSVINDSKAYNSILGTR
jgi:carboxyl-terminal processing protease